MDFISGERRIRVHTLCLPTSASVTDIINGADQQAVIGMLAKFGKNYFIAIIFIGNNNNFLLQLLIDR